MIVTLSVLREWEGRPTSHWAAVWRVPRLAVLSVTTSTNDVARDLVASGESEGTVVIAEAQTRGRGRSGQTWFASPGAGLLLSVVLRVEAAAGETPDPGPAPIRVGMAAARAVHTVSGLDVGIKWPNDLVLGDGRKLGGVLCEATTGPSGTHVIAGVGINVHERLEDFPPALRASATSLAMASATDIDRASLAQALLDRLRPFRIPAGPLEPQLMREWIPLDALAGVRITLDGVVAGTARGIAPDGSLRIDAADGLRLVRTGSVRPASHSDPGMTP